MKKTYSLVIIIGLNFLISLSLIAQDARFAQSYANPLRINPAIMGANTDMKFILDYRNQWASIDKGYKTYSFTGMYPVFLDKGMGKFDVGITVMNDKAGAFSNTDVALAVDYSKEISPNNNLCLSLIGGFVQQKLDLNKQTFDNQYVLGSYNANNPSNELALGNKTSYSDFGFGFMWFLNPNRDKSKLNAYIGIAGYHLNQPNQTFLAANGKLPTRLAYQGGLTFFGDNKIDISPNVRVCMQNGNMETAAGLYANYNFNDNAKLVIGTWYRTHDAIAILIGFEHKNFAIGYTYDMVNSGLNKVAPRANAHEITFAFKMSRLAKTKKASFAGDENGTSTKKFVSSSPFSSF